MRQVCQCLPQGGWTRPLSKMMRSHLVWERTGWLSRNRAALLFVLLNLKTTPSAPLRNGDVSLMAQPPLLENRTVQITIARIAQRRAQRRRERWVTFGGVVLKKTIPLLASPRGGVAARSSKCREATLARADGVVFRIDSLGKPPRPREKRMLRGFFLIARPPLLAVMQGGEYALPKTRS